MSFTPLNHNFTLLPTHNPAPGVKFYEFKSHPEVTGETNYHRLTSFAPNKIAKTENGTIMCSLLAVSLGS